MKFFIRFFIFLLILAAAAYGYAWHKNKQAVDDIIVKNGGSYKSSYVDINGDSVTTDINFQLPGSSQNITISEVRVGTGSLLSNFKVSKAFASNDLDSLPDHFNLVLDVKEARLPLDPAMDSANSGSDLFFNKATFAGCGDRLDLSVADLSDFGISSLLTDTRVQMSIDQTSSKAFADVYINLDKFNTTKLKFTLNNFNFNNPFGMGIGGGSIEFSDNGIQRNIIALCAKENELSEKQFTERHISYLKHLLFQENIYLSPEFYQQYAKYHTNPRSLKLNFQPSDSLQPMSLMGVSARRLLSLLNAEILINDVSITPLFGNKPDPSELPQLDKVTPEDDGITTIYGLRVQPTAISSIGRYIGYDAYFDYRGQKYKGQILSVSGSSATIRYEINTGNKVTKPFQLNEISNLRIRREYTPPVEATN